MDAALRNFVTALKPVPLAYCDFIAAQIHDHLMDDQRPTLIAEVGNVEWDLHPIGGWMCSTKKTLAVTDINGRRYRVTVEEA